MPPAKQNLQRETLRKHARGKNTSQVVRELISLRLEYSQYSRLLTGYVNKLVNISRIYPTHLPTQASFRWSTINPPITNWPRACINQACSTDEHEWTDQCWSIRDILLPDDDEILVSWDHDNIEGKIHDLVLDDTEAIQAHIEGYDLHTITCCKIFNMELPQNLKDPHNSIDDISWRRENNWQGKDTKKRVLAKNFNHGSKYSPTWRFIYVIPGIEKYGVSRDDLGQLARAYIASKRVVWQRKLDMMESIRKARISRTLYGGRRIFYDSSEDTAKEGFSHMISGTVSDYNNETLILLEKTFGDSTRLLHNAHDGNKAVIKKHCFPNAFDNGAFNLATKAVFLAKLKSIIERPITYQGRSLTMTAGVKIYD